MIRAHRALGVFVHVVGISIAAGIFGYAYARGCSMILRDRVKEFVG